jgi:hypothetical protein
VIFLLGSGREFAAAFMAIVDRHGSLWSVEHAGFVHVVPDSVGAAGGQKIPIQIAPPTSHVGLSEIGKDRRTSPHSAVILLAVFGLHPNVVLHSGIVDRIAWFELGCWIDHPDTFESALMQVIAEPGRVRISYRIKGEDAEAVHIIDIHPDHIAGKIPATEPVSYFFHSALRIVGKTALLISEGPQRRKLDFASVL